MARSGGHFTAARMIEEIDVAMSTLKTSMRGLPYREQGFKRQHDQLARDVATLTVAIEDVCHLLGSK